MSTKGKKLVFIIIFIIIFIGIILLSLSGSQKKTVSEEDKMIRGQMSVEIICEDWNDETSTPIMMAIYSGDVKEVLLSAEEDVHIPQAMSEIEIIANQDYPLDKIQEPGLYTLSIIESPVLEDGTIFIIPEPQVVEFNGQTDQKIKFHLEKKKEDQVKNTDVDESKKATNATDNTHQSVKKDQDKTTKKEQTTTTKKKNNQQNTNSSSESTNKADSTKPSTSKHTHTWVMTTKTIHHSAKYKFVHHGEKRKKIGVCDTCGAKNINDAHLKAHSEKGEGTSWHHEEIVTEPSWDEKVLVRDAYDEIIKEYTCSACGATK